MTIAAALSSRQTMPCRRSTSALYVTATDLPLPQAADLVRAMAGPHRLPDALHLVDQLTRTRP